MDQEAICHRLTVYLQNYLKCKLYSTYAFALIGKSSTLKQTDFLNAWHEFYSAAVCLLTLCFSAAASQTPCFFLDKYSTRGQGGQLLVTNLFLSFLN